MTWSYSGDPSTTNKDAIRYYVGDTDTNEQLVQDEEINYVLAQDSTNILKAAISVAQGILAKLAKKVDKVDKSSAMSVKFSQKYEQYDKLISFLRKKLAIAQGKPYTAGISVSDKQTYQDDTDRLQPAFRRSLHDVPGTNLNPTSTDSLVDV